MGDFRMTIEAVGGHGCDRKAKAGAAQDGDVVRGCGQETCPDCMFARFVSALQRAGMRPKVATFHHWPADMNEHLLLPGADKCSRCGRTTELMRQMGTATHRCKVCSALWRQNADGTWSLVGDYCGKCCDNAAMGDQIESITSGIAETRARSCGSNYTPEHEVVDDYSELGVKYPTGAYTRATGKRIKGSF